MGVLYLYEESSYLERLYLYCNGSLHPCPVPVQMNTWVLDIKFKQALSANISEMVDHQWLLNKIAATKIVISCISNVLDNIANHTKS